MLQHILHDSTCQSGGLALFLRGLNTTFKSEKKMKYRNYLLVGMLLLLGGTATAQQGLTLDECRRMALENSKSLRQADLKRTEAHDVERAALWQMLPKVSAVGGYVWTERSVNLLSEEQKERISHLGDNVQSDISSALHDELGDVPLVGELLADRLDNVLAGSGLGTRLNSAGQDIVDGLETDTRNMGGMAVTLTQPIYLGGKLMALHNSAKLLEHLAEIEYSKEESATVVAVDEAYWQVVSVQHKKELAERYATLLDTLERNVSLAVEAEMATTGDLAKVRVKRNEAQMSLTKATNGLALAKMLLAERCGMPLDTVFEIYDELEFKDKTSDNAAILVADYSMDEVYARRNELQMLHISDSIAREGVRIAASTLKPNIVATAGYMATNPNIFDGFSNTWGGTWMAGVAVQVPLFNPSGVYSVKAAKTKRRETACKMQEAEELIALQVNKVRYEHELAWKKMDQAQSNLAMAEENLRLADESFREGMCSSSDLMAAQTAWMQAEGDVLDAKIEIEMTRVYLKQALGN